MRGFLILVISLASTIVWAQTGGSVAGQITDETGGALPGVTVELVGTGQPLEQVTDG
jgi:hypothetical protein